MEFDVVEREAVEVETAAERRARILEAAALEIEVRGWTQGANGMAHKDAVCKQACLLGGIAYVLGGGASYSVGEDVFGEDSIVLYDFNDTRGRTAADVTFLLRWRAEEIRDGR